MSPAPPVDDRPVDDRPADDRPVLEVGTELPELRHTITRDRLVRYAGASGDFNPIHYSDRVAGAMGLPGVIAHGLLTAGLALRVVTDWLGSTASILDYRLRFARPVVVPDTDGGVDLVTTGTVSEVLDDRITITLSARCGEESVLTGAKVVVARPRSGATDR